MLAEGAARPLPVAALAAFGLVAVVAGLAGAVPGQAAGWLAVAALADALRRMPHEAVGAEAWACFGLALVLAALPSRLAAAVALLPLALMVRPLGVAGRGAAVLLVALALAGLAEGGAGQLVAPPVLTLEAEAVRVLLSAAGLAGDVEGNTLLLPETGRVLVVLRGCSALALLPPLLLAAVALARLIAPEAGLPALRIAIAAAVALLLNLSRLAAMAVSPEAATFFHAPEGEALLQVTWLALALAAAWPRTRRPRA